MSGFTAVVLLIQLGIPLALIACVLFARHRSRTAWLLDVVLATTFIILLALAGLWMVLPSWTSWVYVVLLIGATGGGALRLFRRGFAGGTRRHRVGLAVRATALVGLLALVFVALSGRRPLDGNPLDLAFPLQDGTYLVVSGGSHRLVNFHLGTLSGERTRPFRGQSYAVDLVKLGRWGSRNAGILPDDPRHSRSTTIRSTHHARALW
jgi:hypothetical protein